MGGEKVAGETTIPDQMRQHGHHTQQIYSTGAACHLQLSGGKHLWSPSDSWGENLLEVAVLTGTVNFRCQWLFLQKFKSWRLQMSFALSNDSRRFLPLCHFFLVTQQCVRSWFPRQVPRRSDVCLVWWGFVVKRLFFRLAIEFKCLDQFENICKYCMKYYIWPHAKTAKGRTNKEWVISLKSNETDGTDRFHWSPFGSQHIVVNELFTELNSCDRSELTSAKPLDK